MLRVVSERVIRPDDGAVTVDGSRAVGAEVEEDMPAVGDGRGAREAVFRMALRRRHVLREQFFVPQGLPRGGVETKGTQRLLCKRCLRRRNGGGQKHTAVVDDWRRPPLPGERYLPTDMVGGGERRRQAGRGRVPLPQRAAEVGPALGRAEAGGGDQQSGDEQADDCRRAERRTHGFPRSQVDKARGILARETALPHQAIAWMPIRLPAGSARIASGGARVDGVPIMGGFMVAWANRRRDRVAGPPQSLFVRQPHRLRLLQSLRTGVSPGTGDAGDPAGGH